MGGTCNGSQSGVAGADALCEARASNAGLPSGFSYKHYAMLHRGGTGDPAHPKNLDIPNKERPVKKPDGTLIVGHYDKADASDDDFWDTGHGSDLTPIGARTEATRSDFNVTYYWTGLNNRGAIISDNCGDWANTTDNGALGNATRGDSDRFYDGSSANCADLEFAEMTSLGVLCASY